MIKIIQIFIIFRLLNSTTLRSAAFYTADRANSSKNETMDKGATMTSSSWALTRGSGAPSGMWKSSFVEAAGAIGDIDNSVKTQTQT